MLFQYFNQSAYPLQGHSVMSLFQVRGDDEGDAVTYSTVKAHSSSAAATADPSSLYSTLSFPVT